MNQFQKDLQKGHSGEAIINYLLQSYNYLTAYNTSNKLSILKQYDISYTGTTTPRKTAKIEVKTDFKHHLTGNLLIEFQYNNEDSGILTTTAQYYYIVTKYKIYIITTKELKKLYNNHYQQLRIVDNYAHNSLSFLLSEEEIIDFGVNYRIVNYSINNESSSISFNSIKSSSSISLDTTDLQQLYNLFSN